MAMIGSKVFTRVLVLSSLLILFASSALAARGISLPANGDRRAQKLVRKHGIRTTIALPTTSRSLSKHKHPEADMLQPVKGRAEDFAMQIAEMFETTTSGTHVKGNTAHVPLNNQHHIFPKSSNSNQEVQTSDADKGAVKSALDKVREKASKNDDSAKAPSGNKNSSMKGFKEYYSQQGGSGSEKKKGSKDVTTESPTHAPTPTPSTSPSQAPVLSGGNDQQGHNGGDDDDDEGGGGNSGNAGGDTNGSGDSDGSDGQGRGGDGVDIPIPDPLQLNQAAFKYTTEAKTAPTQKDEATLVEATKSMFTALFEHAYGDLLDSTDVFTYQKLTPRIFRFGVTVHFKNENEMPSQSDFENKVSQLLKTDGKFNGEYKKILAATGSAIFATVTSIEYINDKDALDKAVSESIPSAPKDEAVSESISSAPKEKSENGGDSGSKFELLEIFFFAIGGCGLVLAFVTFCCWYFGRGRRVHVQNVDRLNLHDPENLKKYPAKESLYRTTSFSKDVHQSNRYDFSHAALDNFAVADEKDVEEAAAILEDVSLFDEESEHMSPREGETIFRSSQVDSFAEGRISTDPFADERNPDPFADRLDQGSNPFADDQGSSGSTADQGAFHEDLLFDTAPPSVPNGANEFVQDLVEEVHYDDLDDLPCVQDRLAQIEAKLSYQGPDEESTVGKSAPSRGSGRGTPSPLPNIVGLQVGAATAEQMYTRPVATYASASSQPSVKSSSSNKSRQSTGSSSKNKCTSLNTNSEARAAVMSERMASFDSASLGSGRKATLTKAPPSPQPGSGVLSPRSQSPVVKYPLPPKSPSRATPVPPRAASPYQRASPSPRAASPYQRASLSPRAASPYQRASPSPRPGTPQKSLHIPTPVSPRVEPKSPVRSSKEPVWAAKKLRKPGEEPVPEWMRKFEDMGLKKSED